MIKRKYINKKTKNEVFLKYNGHCSYCGNKLTPKTFVIDHFIPLRRGGNDDFDNYMPACRECNHYKLTYDIEGFRHLILTAEERLLKPLLGRVCRNFKIITINHFDGKFYFEKINDLNKDKLKTKN